MTTLVGGRSSESSGLEVVVVVVEEELVGEGGWDGVVLDVEDCEESSLVVGGGMEVTGASPKVSWVTVGVGRNNNKSEDHRRGLKATMAQSKK